MAFQIQLTSNTRIVLHAFLVHDQADERPTSKRYATGADSPLYSW